QSHRSHRCAYLGNKCPQYGHGILSALTSCDWVGASVYSKLPPNVQATSQEVLNSSSKLTKPRIAIGSANFRRAAQIITDGVPHPNSPTLGQIFARWRNRRLAKCVERFADRKFRPHHEDWSRRGCFDTCLERSRKKRCRSFARASWVILVGPATSD